MANDEEAEDDGMTIAELAKALEVSRDAVYDWARDGRIAVGKLPSGRWARIPRTEVERVLREAGVTHPGGTQ